MPRKVRYKVRAEVSTLQQQILAEVNEMMKTDTSSELTMLRDKVAALFDQSNRLSTLTESVRKLASQAEKLGLKTANPPSEIDKQVKVLADTIEQPLRSIIKDEHGAKYGTRRVISSAQDVLDFIADNLGKDEQWRSQAADLLRRKMEEEV